ncbi:MAG: MBOAT family protein [Bacteroidaceae bacterium]|nr:MBOAT family protein [Bacteroidaceae bacterium]
MLFNSIAFLLFFPVICILYYAIPAQSVKARNMLLLVASYYFYMNWEPAYALLLLTSTVVTYLAAIGISRSEDRKKKKAYLISSIVLNLAILFLFKYYNFIGSNIQSLFQLMGIGLNVPKFTLLLPVGISFYTFQALGYSIDVYYGKTDIEKSFPTYALFVSFFPQLVAGPIERSGNLLPQFKQKHEFDYDEVMAGLRLMIWGYFMKLVLADRCGIYVDNIFNNIDKHNGGSYLVASLLFPFQIYGDFAGYSFIAIGTARVLGFRLMDNFRRPYLSSSVGEFWHRWHISLSTWFKDYVYIPLGGNRVKRARAYTNLLITFIVSGIWHGANWTFLCWGCLHGVLLCIEKALEIGKQNYTGFKRLLHWAATFVLVSLAWILFRADTVNDALTIITGIFTNPGIPKLEIANFIAIGLAMVILTAKELTDEFNLKFRIAESQSWLVRHLYLVFMISYIILLGVLGGDQFIYFQF